MVMKRSEINAIIQDALDFFEQCGFHLPPFAYWSPGEWALRGKEVCEIVECQLGWDVTDLGQGSFQKVGLVLFTLRNGRPENLKSGQGKLYAEKIMISNVDQVTPMHFHWSKTEDIINRAGGKLVIQLYNATHEGELAESPVSVSVDAVERTLAPGGKVVLSPGESITLQPYCYHRFWAEESRVLIGEVSLVNDDDTDNRFYESLGRFPEIEEDEPPLYLMVKDYHQYYEHGGKHRGD
jgi:D-lyxose ketol-isomerase